MKASGRKIRLLHPPGQRRPDEWVGVITWRLGFRGRSSCARKRAGVREKLRELDPTIGFTSGGNYIPEGKGK